MKIRKQCLNINFAKTKKPWILIQGHSFANKDSYSSESITHSAFHSSSGTDSYQSLVWV